MPALAAMAASCGDYLSVEPTVDRLEITAPRRTLVVGDTLQLQATAYGARGAYATTNKLVIGWASSAPAVATVNASSGLVTAFALGRATIRAIARGKQDTVTVTVVASAVR
ncbi:Ig domain protein group 2 domain protein (plasmid) [Gemmatirosa kalamazoonensis]|uniref:Ig domain protein group 2 domain protein n=2 Tax=Gemmatirosa kalamazoonensis TaxID=861299 RepID=W0RVE8_9BACT|nr:Ig domain protein group 2 domain protein [Gemmatirosa kalamazoonensis]